MDEAQLLARARDGDEVAFATLTRPLADRLRVYVARMIAVPDDAQDIVQETFLRAHQRLADFRGDASFKNWVFTIATRLCLDHLRKAKRWRPDAQVHGFHAAADPAVRALIDDALTSPEATFSAYEHIAFCFSCVGRSLEPTEKAVLILREVVGLTNREAAAAVGVSEAVFRHRLRAARTAMQEAYEGRCSLVAKSGVCLQCSQLAEVFTAARGTSVNVPSIEGADAEERMTVRLRIVHETHTTPVEDQLQRVLAELMDRVEAKAE